MIPSVQNPAGESIRIFKIKHPGTVLVNTHNHVETDLDVSCNLHISLS